MSTTAQDIIDRAADDCNIKQPGESFGDSAEALVRLNNLVTSLNLQSLVSNFQAREIFQLTTNKSSYTIGPGGNFNTTRPMTLDGAAVLQSPTITTVAAADTTTSGFTVAGDQTTIFTSGSEFSLEGSTGGVNDGNYTVVSSAFSASTTIVVAEAIIDPAPMTDGTITCFTSGTSTVEIPRAIYTDDAWQAIQVKALSNVYATGVYYNASYARGLGLIQLWPVPNVATYALVLYRRNMLATFVDLDTTYDLPPGFDDVLEYGLAERLLIPYAIKEENVIGGVMRMAAKSLRLVKAQNAVNQMNDMPIDPAYTNDQRGYYNIVSGQGGGA